MSRASRRRPSKVAVYLTESRELGASLVLVVPLLVAYELAMLVLEAPYRNGAEMVVSDLVRTLPADTLTIVRRFFLAALIVATVWLSRRSPPRIARAHWVLGEALLLAMILGPLVGWMVGRIGLSAPAEVASGPISGWMPFLLSVGAGLWEEIVFRLGLLGGTVLVARRVCGLPDRPAIGVAVGLSALAFALYHHVGDMGEPLIASRFAFRAFAGVILGLLFVLRGFAVVVYMHVFYDVLCDLRGLLD